MESTSIWEAFLVAAENEGFFYWSELLAVITGVIYVLLAAKNNSWCWIWGIISSALWAYAAYVLFDLYVDALLQVFYVIMGGLGWYRWTHGGTQNQLPITTMKHQEHVASIGGGLLLSLAVGYLFDEYTPAAAPYVDAFTTVFSILATFMVVNRKLENWLYWIVIDVTYCFLYFSRGGYLFAILFVVYTLIAVLGYLRWHREWQSRDKVIDN